ncbi:unnamed protein product [Arctogadus glacialis]
MSSYLFIVKSELPLVIPAFLGKHENTGEWFLEGNYLIMIVSAALILPPSLTRRLGYPGYTSGFSLSCMVFFLISVIYKSSSPSTSQAACTIPILAFAFLRHPEALPIHTELRDANKKPRMQRVAHISIPAMFVVYLLAALFGNLTFYMGVDHLHVLFLCVRLAALVAVTLTVPAVLFPIRRAIIQIVCPGQALPLGPGTAPSPCWSSSTRWSPWRPPDATSSASSEPPRPPSLILILPGVFYIRIIPGEQEPLRSWTKILAACFAARGFILVIMGLTITITDWVSGGVHSGGGH